MRCPLYVVGLRPRVGRRECSVRICKQRYFQNKIRFFYVIICSSRAFVIWTCNQRFIQQWMNIFQKTTKSIRPKNVFQKLLNGVDETWTGSSHSECISCKNHHKKGPSSYREYCGRTYIHTQNLSFVLGNLTMLNFTSPRK